jgi:hypothetical protein
MRKRSAACITLLLATIASAQTPAVTQHAISVHGAILHYTAEAGWIPLTGDSSRDAHGRLFYTAYLLAGVNRPVTFVWNGGPGASSSFVHFLGFGPQLIDGTKFVDNPDTPLPATDLVFVDPIGTGFSRPTSTRYSPEYFSTLGDAKSVTQFIMNWLKAHKAEKRPVFLMGESFGGYRAGGVTERMESAGWRVSGVILISGGAASGPLIPPVVRAALATPPRAAAALVLGKSAPELGTDRTTIVRAATRWSLETYLPALANKESLTDAQRDSVIAALHRFTGFPAERIDRKTLTIGFEYLQVMAPDSAHPLSPFDMRSPHIPFPDSATMDTYFRKTLGVRTELAYWDEPPAGDSLGPSEKTWVWNYRWPESEKYGSDWAEPWLPHAIAIDSGIKVLVAAGQYDATNSCEENDVLHALLEPDLAWHYTMRCYLGGHVIYRDPAARVALSADVVRFITERVRAQ